MNLLSLNKYKIFGELNSSQELFLTIFNEAKIPSLSDFYNHWSFTEKENFQNSQYKAMKRMVEEEPKTFSSNRKNLYCCLCKIEEFIKLRDHIEEFIPNHNQFTLANIIKTIGEEIINDLPKNSKFSFVLSILIKNHIHQQKAKSTLLTWYVIYCIFKNFYNKFELLYNIMNKDTYEKIYSDIISGTEILQFYNKYASKENSKTEITPDFSEFINNSLKNGSKEITIISISGQWALFDDKCRKSIVDFLESNGKINIIINSEPVAELLISNMRNRYNNYSSIKSSIDEWKIFQNEFSENLKVYLTDIPILHNIIYTNIYNNNLSAIHLYFYTYPDTFDIKNYTMLLYEKSQYFDLFYREMELFKKQKNFV